MSGNRDSRPSSTRIRASEKAIGAALRAIRAAGLTVDKMCVDGARVEIHCGRVDAGEQVNNDGGLKDW